jgi:hypothetical protein
VDLDCLPSFKLEHENYLIFKVYNGQPSGVDKRRTIKEIKIVYRKIKKIGNLGIFLALFLMLTLSACGSANADATPTMSVDAIFTAAFQTLSAQQATQLALTPPPETPSPTLFPTPALLPTQSGSLLFGSPTSSFAGGAVGCDSSSYVKDVTIPDGTVMNPGKAFVKTWLILNNGTCEWKTSYQLTYISGEKMNGASTAVLNAVPAGQQMQVSVNLTAPSAAGDYTGWWRMQNDKGQYFGNSVSVVIKVSGSTTTGTSSGATNTSATSTNTSATATNTPVTPTDTSEPTAATP